MRKLTLLAAASTVCAFAPAAFAQDEIRIVGSSTVFPFSASVAEQFGAKTEFGTPIVESTGSGGGMKAFCAGVGDGTPDITNASRRMKASEYELCTSNGVTDVTEVVIGFDGIVIANAKDAPQFDLTQKQIFMALAAEVPTAEDDCTMVANPNETWSDVDASLPATPIEVFGPPPTSGTRDAFVELAMEGGAKQISCLAELRSEDKGAFQEIAHTLREDGPWIDAGENDNSIVATLANNSSTLGVFGYSYLDQNGDRIKGASIDGVTPDFDAIANGDYPVSRSLYFYVKNQHVGIVPGLKEYALEFTSEEAWGPFGYLAEKGLISLPDEQRAAERAHVEALASMTGEGL